MIRHRCRHILTGYCEHEGDRAADGQFRRSIIVRALAALLLVAAALPTEAQMILPEVPHYELRSAPEIRPKPNYGRPYEPDKTKGSDENNKGQDPKSFRERLSGTLDKSLDDPVAFVTLCLVAIAGMQALLFVWQLILIKLSLNDAKLAAEAARDGAKGTLETVKVLRNAQRPYLSPFDPELRNFDKPMDSYSGWSQIIEIHLDVTNIGKGVGFIRSYAIAHEICPRGQQGTLVPRVRDYIARLPLGPDSKWQPDAPFDVFQIHHADREAMLNSKKILYVYGYVRFYAGES
jgi:hypothetical protein